MSNCLGQVSFWACSWAIVLFAFIEVGKPATRVLHSSLGLGPALFKQREDNEQGGASAHSFLSARDWGHDMKSYWKFLLT